MVVNQRFCMFVGIVIVGGILFGCGYRVTEAMLSNQTYPPKLESYHLNFAPHPRFLSVGDMVSVGI